MTRGRAANQYADSYKKSVNNKHKRCRALCPASLILAAAMLGYEVSEVEHFEGRFKIAV